MILRSMTVLSVEQFMNRGKNTYATPSNNKVSKKVTLGEIRNLNITYLKIKRAT